MTYIKLIMPLIMINMALAQSPTVTVKGSHTLTQGDGVGIYEAVDLCLKQAIINGVFDYLNTNSVLFVTNELFGEIVKTDVFDTRMPNQ